MQHAVRFENAAQVHAAAGSEVCVSDWVVVDQQRIDTFAKATGDHQWIHVDVARAAAQSPFGCTIAHGFLTLSLLGQFYEEYLTHALPFCGMGLNYGLNKVRFTAPVRVNRRVRPRFTLAAVDDITGGLQLTFAITVDIDGEDKPACVVESIVRRMFQS
jgi:acyl dehydratase